MASSVALCLDAHSWENPELIGLDNENLEAQPWLKLFCEGQDARDKIVQDEEVGEVWVASCDDVEAINLAAAIKADRPSLAVRLMDFQGGGSVLSRAHTASIDEVLGKRAFVERYSEAKRQMSQLGKHAVASEPEPAREERATTLAAPGSVAPVQATQAVQQAEAAAAPGSVAPVQATQAVQPALLAPAQPEFLMQAARPAQQAQALAASCFVLPVVSGSGGAGKSSVSVLSALIAHSMGKRTLLLDYDLQFGDAAVMMGVESPLTIDEAMGRPDKLAREIERTDRPALLAAPTRLEMAESVAQLVPRLLADVGESFDVVIANTGASWAEQHAALLERATATLFLVDQRSSSVRACRHALELCARCGIATGQFQFVLNRCAKGAPLTAMDASFALQGVPVLELRDGGRDVEDYLAAGAAAELLETGNDLCSSLAQVISGLLTGGVDQEAQAPERSKASAGSRRRGRHGAKRRGWGK